jgi:hypothetical protein
MASPPPSPPTPPPPTPPPPAALQAGIEPSLMPHDSSAASAGPLGTTFALTIADDSRNAPGG